MRKRKAKAERKRQERLKEAEDDACMIEAAASSASASASTASASASTSASSQLQNDFWLAMAREEALETPEGLAMSEAVKELTKERDEALGRLAMERTRTDMLLVEQETLAKKRQEMLHFKAKRKMREARDASGR